MAKKEEIKYKVGVDSKEAEKGLNEIAKSAEKTADSVESLKDETSSLGKETKNIGKSVGSLKKIAGGFKGIGLAIKAAGIGLVIEAFNLLRDALGENQKAVDAMNIVFEVFSRMVGDLVNVVFDSFPTIIDYFKKIFNDPQKAVKDLGDAIKKNLMERFNSLIDMYKNLGSAISKIFKGDWEGAVEDFKKTGKEMVDVVTGVEGSFDKLAEGAKKVGTAIVDYTKNTIDASVATIEARKNADAYGASLSKLISKLEGQAEAERAIADDTTKSIDDRIAALDRLKDKDKEISDAKIKQAQLELNAANLQLQKDKENVEFKKAVAEAETAVQDAKNEASAKDQENKRVENELDLEKANLSISKRETDLEIREEDEAFRLEQIENEVERLEQEQISADESYEIALQLAKDKAALLGEGTTERQEADNEIKKIEKAKTRTDKKRKKDTEKAKESDVKTTEQAEHAKKQAKVQGAENALGTVSALTEAAGIESKELNVAMAMADAVIGVQKAYLSQLIPGEPTSLPRAIGAGIQAGVFGALNVAKVAGVKFENGGVVPGGGGLAEGPSHSQGGIAGVAGGQAIEFEGGEFITNTSASSRNLSALNMINSNPNQDFQAIPMAAGGGSLIGNANQQASLDIQASSFNDMEVQFIESKYKDFKRSKVVTPKTRGTL